MALPAFKKPAISLGSATWYHTKSRVTIIIKHFLRQKSSTAGQIRNPYEKNHGYFFKLHK
jgi:hypothetical protein